MDVVFVLIHTVHIFGALLWVGGAVYLNLVVFPFKRQVPLEAQRATGFVMSQKSGAFFGAAGGITILFGILRGVVGGRIDSLEVLSTPYGIVWLSSLAFSVGLAAWGARVIGPAATALYQDKSLWIGSSEGEPSSALLDRFREVKKLIRVDMCFFGLIVVAMVFLAKVL